MYACMHCKYMEFPVVVKQASEVYSPPPSIPPPPLLSPVSSRPSRSVNIPMVSTRPYFTLLSLAQLNHSTLPATYLPIVVVQLSRLCTFLTCCFSCWNCCLLHCCCGAAVFWAHMRFETLFCEGDVEITTAQKSPAMRIFHPNLCYFLCSLVSSFALTFIFFLREKAKIVSRHSHCHFNPRSIGLQHRRRRQTIAGSDAPITVPIFPVAVFCFYFATALFRAQITLLKHVFVLSASFAACRPQWLFPSHSQKAGDHFWLTDWMSVGLSWVGLSWSMAWFALDRLGSA